MRTLMWCGFVFLGTTECFAQSFSCSMGQPACVGYDEKVVRQDAQCFAGYTCFPGGFVCKSDMDELADKAKRMAQGWSRGFRRSWTACWKQAGRAVKWYALYGAPDRRRQQTVWSAAAIPSEVLPLSVMV